MKSIIYTCLLAVSFFHAPNAAFGCEKHNKKVYLESDYKGEKDYITLGDNQYHLTKENDVLGIMLKKEFHPLKEEQICHKVIVTKTSTSLQDMMGVKKEECTQKNFKLLPKHFVSLKKDMYDALSEEEHYSFTFDIKQ